jgi:hypothetical protein
MQDSLAKILVSLEIRPDLEKALGQGFTEKSCESLAWYDQDTSSWRTYQRSFLTDWELYSETWPRWGMTVNGSALRHPMSAHRMGAIDGSVWLGTPTASMKRQATNGGRKNRSRPGNLREQVDPLMCQAYDEARMEANQPKMWPTPRANSAMASTITQDSAWKEGRFLNLETQVGRQMWPTPTAHNAKETNAPSESNRNTPTLAAEVGGKLNPTWVAWLMGFPIEWVNLKG